MKWANSVKVARALGRLFDVLLPYVWVLPVAGSVLLVSRGVSLTGTVLLGDVQLSDGAGWLSCSFSFPVGQDWKSDWCLRRPAASLILSLHAKTLFLGTFAPILLNVAIPSISMAFLLVTVRQMGASAFAVILVAPVPLYMSLVLGMYFGPEAMALALTALSLTFLGRLYMGREGGLLYAGPLLVGFAFLARPGNIGLILSVALVSLLFAFRDVHRSRAVLIVLASSAAPWLFIQFLRLFPGLENAGHSANSASIFYSLASNKASSWNEVYEIFDAVEGVDGASVDSVIWRDYVNRAAYTEFLEAPGVALGQVLNNFVRFFDQGFLNLILNFPNPSFLGLKLASWLANAQNLGDFAIEQAGLGLWVVSTVILLKVSLSFVGLVILFVRQGHRGLPGLTHILLGGFPILLLASAIFGAFLFFGVVGHVEAYRHLSMTIPVTALLPFLWEKIVGGKGSGHDG